MKFAGAADFQAWFRRACGFPPLPYQRRLAEEGCLPELVEVPTGLGKTEAVFLAWLWRRLHGTGSGAGGGAPRRLVWCLPMRALVEQTAERISTSLDRLRSGGDLSGQIAVHRLLGGEPASDWADAPEAEAVLVGTQDMLLSRALNRGYACSRYRWPREFGLLHTDSLWVFDEVQLMGVGRITSAQLEAFRREMGGYRPARSLWMSATMRREWLETVDLRAHLAGVEPLRLSAEDRAHPIAAQRLAAKKPVRALGLVAPAKKSEGKRHAAELAEAVLEHHRPGSTTLCVLNTVSRARALREALASPRSGDEGPDLLLLHSRFRPPDRQRILERLRSYPPESGRIAVCTQVVEAGLDLSARTLITELAPWSSLVQRFGRCNRRGELGGSGDGENGGAEVLWCDLEAGAEPPYRAEELDLARRKLADLRSASPKDLPLLEGEGGLHPVLRRRELLDLFDTDPDLCGADLDVSGYIREGTDRDVSIFWRAMDGPPEGDLQPAPEELCAVPIDAAREFLLKALERKHGGAFVFDVLEEGWRPLRPRGRDLEPRLVPGRVLLLDASVGGYDPEIGWTGEPARRGQAVPAVSAPVSTGEERHASDDPRSFRGVWVELADHIDDVVEAARVLLARLEDLELDSGLHEAVLAACRWHDAGKSHAVFQETLLSCAPAEERAPRGDHLWAKAAGKGPRHRRRGFRHELASGLAALAAGQPDLVAYLAAAHHGKVRLAIRSLPGEEPCPDCAKGGRFARGVHEHDELPEADLGGGVRLSTTPLDLSCMEMGLDEESRPSWQDRMLSLLEELGPFRLAFLESLVRVADARGSAARRDAEATEVTHA